MRLEDKQINERRFAVMEMAGEGNVAQLIGIIHQVGHEGAVEEDGRQVGLFNVEALLLNRGDDGLGEELCIFLFYPSLDVGAIYLLGSGIVLLVLVKDDGICRAICKRGGGQREEEDE